jgi:hypothetical protein
MRGEHIPDFAFRSSGLQRANSRYGSYGVMIQKCFLANALPELVLRYSSNLSALS